MSPAVAAGLLPAILFGGVLVRVLSSWMSECFLVLGIIGAMDSEYYLFSLHLLFVLVVLKSKPAESFRTCYCLRVLVVHCTLGQ